MAILYAYNIPGSIPGKLVVLVPAGQVVTDIDHSCDGAAALLNLEVGLTSQNSESTNLNLSKVCTPQYGGHQKWHGRMSHTGDLFIKAWLRSVGTGGSHNVVVKTE